MVRDAGPMVVEYVCKACRVVTGRIEFADIPLAEALAASERLVAEAIEHRCRAGA